MNCITTVDSAINKLKLDKKELTPELIKSIEETILSNIDNNKNILKQNKINFEQKKDFFEETIKEKPKVELSSQNKTLLIPVEKPNSANQEFEGFKNKGEHHITALGFPQGKQIKKLIEDNPQLEETIEQIVSEADLSYEPTGKLYKIQRDREVFVDWKDKSKGKEIIHEEAIIETVDAPGIEQLVKDLNEALGTKFPIPFPHISVATKNTDFGIGIPNEAGFKDLSPELLNDKNATTITPKTLSNGTIKYVMKNKKGRVLGTASVKKGTIKETLESTKNGLKSYTGSEEQLNKEYTTISLITIKPEFEGQGHGDTLLKEVLNQHKNEDILIESLPMEDNTDAERLSTWYGRNGFKNINGIEPEIANIKIKPANTVVYGSTSDTDGIYEPELGDEIVRQETIDFGENDNLFTLIEELFQADANPEVDGIRKPSQTIQTQEFLGAQQYLLEMFNNAFKEINDSKIDLKMIETSIDEAFANANQKRETAGSLTVEDGRTPELAIRWNKFSGTARQTEVLMHELVHYMTNKAFEGNVLVKESLNKLREAAIDAGITYEIFLENTLQEGETYSSEDIELAKKRFDYVFSESADPIEFFAYAATNEWVFHAIKNLKIEPKLIDEINTYVEEDGQMIKKNSSFDDFLNVFIDVINKLWIALTQQKDTGQEVIFDFMKQLINTEIELKNKNFEEENQVVEDRQFIESMKKLDDGLGRMIKESSDIVEKMRVETNTSAGFQRFTKLLEKVVVLDKVIKSRMFQNIYTSISEHTDDKRVAYVYKMFRQGKKITEKNTNLEKQAIKDYIKNLFENEDEGVKKAITSIIFQLDLSSLVHDVQYDIGDVQEFLVEDHARLNEEIENITKSLETLYENKQRTQYSSEYKAEFEKDLEYVDALAKHMNDGIYHKENMQLNADNIYIKLYKSGLKELDLDEQLTPIDTAIITFLDRLITLKGIKEAPVENKNIIHEYLNNASNISNVTKVIDMYETYVNDIGKELKYTNFNPIKKGYMEGQNAKQKKYDIVRASEVPSGMEVFGEYGTILGENYVKVAGNSYEPSFTEGAFSIAGSTSSSEGLSLKALISKKLNEDNYDRPDYDKITARDIDFIGQVKIDELVANGGKAEWLNVFDGNNIIPVYDHLGNIVDYNININKLEQIENLGLNTSIEDVTAHTFSRMKHKEAAMKHNKTVVDTVIKFARENSEERPEDFILIQKFDPDSNTNYDEDNHGRWNRLPDHTRNYIFEKTGRNSLYINKAHLELILGEKDVSIQNAKMFGFDLRNHKRSRAFLRKMEAGLFEIVKYLKNVIVIRNVGVFLGNIFSNMWTAAIEGRMNPIDFAKKFIKKWKELDEYTKLQRKLADLHVRKASGENVDNQIRIIQNRLDNSSFHDLVEDGQFSPIVEDINTEEGQFKGHLAEKIDELVEQHGILKSAKKIADVLLVAQNTRAYRIMLKATQYGDVITREILREEKIKNFKKDTNRNMTNIEYQSYLDKLDQMFINYSYLDNRFLKWFENAFALLFTKFLFRNIKALHRLLEDNPMRVISFALIQNLTGLDFKDSSDDLYNVQDALYNRFQWADPINMGMTIVNPLRMFDVTPFPETIAKSFIYVE